MRVLLHEESQHERDVAADVCGDDCMQSLGKTSAETVEDVLRSHSCRLCS